MASSLLTLPPSEIKQPAWLLSKLGLCSNQLSALLEVTGKLEARAAKASEFYPTEPWTGCPEQEEALQQLQVLLADAGEGVTQRDTKWFLRDSGFDAVEAENKIRYMLAWRQAHRLQVSLQDVMDEFSTHKTYVHSHTDLLGRPAFVVRASRHVQGQFPLATTKRMFAVIIDESVSKLPSGCDQIIGIINLKGFSLANVDLPFAAFVVEAFQAMYPRRVAQILLVDAPWLFKGPWEVIKPLLRKYAALVRFVSRQELAQEFFTPDTLPLEFAS